MHFTVKYNSVISSDQRCCFVVVLYAVVATSSRTLVDLSYVDLLLDRYLFWLHVLSYNVW